MDRSLSQPNRFANHPALWIAGMLIVLLASGCMPSMEKVKEDKPRTTKEATMQWTSTRGMVGQSRKIKYTIDGNEYTALWEINRALGGAAKLQLKLPKDKFDHALAYRAVEHALVEEPDQAWYYPIEDTFLDMLRNAQRQVGKGINSDKIIAGDRTPDMPYDCTVIVADHSQDWFIECRASIIPGMD